MKKVTEYPQAELNEQFRRAFEAQLAEEPDTSVDMVLNALEANRTVVKRALRAKASVNSVRKHLEIFGVKCSNDCLRVALNRGGFRRAKSAKADGETPGAANGDNAP